MKSNGQASRRLAVTHRCLEDDMVRFILQHQVPNLQLGPLQGVTASCVISLTLVVRADGLHRRSASESEVRLTFISKILADSSQRQRRKSLHSNLS